MAVKEVLSWKRSYENGKRISRRFPLRKRVAAYARVSSGKDAMPPPSAQVSYYSEHIQSHPNGNMAACMWTKR